MEIQLDKRFPVAAHLDQAWAVLSQLEATAACMPGAQITEQLDETHFKGIVKTRVGPASMQFQGEIELQELNAEKHALRLLGKGADKAGSSASMLLSAHLEPGEKPDDCVLVGQAKVTVSGKLAQFGSRLLVPVSEAMLQQFAANFVAAAQAVPVEVTPQEVAPVAAPPMQELNALALAWTVIKGWLAGLFGRKP